ncbi:anti-sigma factor [Curtobacterium sp. DN_7.5]|uniref:anti-sigma factor n=1 Tax=Curtobacterium sp. DN_7.5 TaxID=3049047 RepID=UPI001F579D91|nr:anti-sigma factor [Curtobacterium sp. DN_7.5]
MDDETLAMLAVTDVVADDEVAGHLVACAQCRAEVADLQRVAAVTRSAADVDLVAPPERVWDRIAVTVRAEQAGDGLEARVDPASPEQPDAGPGPTPDVGSPAQPVVSPTRPGVAAVRPSGRRDRPGTATRRRRRRTIAGVVAAGVGALALLVGVGVVTGVVPGPGSGETVVARATLDALPDWGGARGTAELERDRDGRLTLVVDVSGDRDASDTGTLREVWMMRSDLKGLVSVGFLDGDRGRFTVPAHMDPAKYPVIDVSAERDDGDPTHSGDSIVRGDLHDR